MAILISIITIIWATNVVNLAVGWVYLKKFAPPSDVDMPEDHVTGMATAVMYAMTIFMVDAVVVSARYPYDQRSQRSSSAQIWRCWIIWGRAWQAIVVPVTFTIIEISKSCVLCPSSHTDVSVSCAFVIWERYVKCKGLKSRVEC